MKHTAKLPSRARASSSSASAHRLSDGVAKSRPWGIRIVHIRPPKIIKTEPRHFRNLVQRLTGQPTPKSADAAAASPEYAPSYSSPDSCFVSPSEECIGVGSAATIRAEVKEEVEMPPGAGGEYLRSLGIEEDSDEAFFQYLEDVFSTCDMGLVSNNQMHVGD